jgi:hypothetical protein
VGGGILVLVLALAMSGGSESTSVDRSSDLRLKEDLQTAQSLWGTGKQRDAVIALDAAIANPSYKGSKLLDQARKQVLQYRQQIAFEQEASEAITAFARQVEDSKKNQTAMKKAEAFWAESEQLVSKYGTSLAARELKGVRDDLNRWRETGAQEAWQGDYNRTKARIKTQHLDTGNFSKAVKEWRQFSQPFEDSQLKAKVTSELAIIDRLAKDAATKLVESVGTDAKAEAQLEEALDRFNETEGHKIILQKLKTFAK